MRIEHHRGRRQRRTLGGHSQRHDRDVGVRIGDNPIEHALRRDDAGEVPHTHRNVEVGTLASGASGKI